MSRSFLVFAVALGASPDCAYTELICPVVLGARVNETTVRAILS